MKTETNLKLFGKYSPPTTVNGVGTFTPLDNANINIPPGPIKASMESSVPGAKVVSGTLTLNTNGGPSTFQTDPITGNG